MTRSGAAVVSIVMIGATLSAIARTPRDDGFPLSTFPMFAVDRPTVTSHVYAIGVTSSGARRTLTPRLAGATQVLQAAALFERAMDAGPDALETLCAAIARRVAIDHAYFGVIAIEIVIGTHDAVGYFVRGEPGQLDVQARCEVPR